MTDPAGLELSQGIPHGKIGTTTVGEVRAVGGEVVASPKNKKNVNHATLSGITAEKASELMTIIPNPAKNEKIKKNQNL